MIPDATEPSPIRGRYAGADIARLLAIIGMMATHLVQQASAEPSAFDLGAIAVVTAIAAGISAPLFAVLGGVSIVFASRRYLRENRTLAACVSLATRGLVLVLLGFALGLVDAPAIVVLAYYGVAMILVAPLVNVPTWVLTGIAVIIGAFGGTLNAAVRTNLGVVTEGGSLSFESFVTDVPGSLRALVLTGVYPAITWVVYLLIGMVLARLLVSLRTRRQLRTVVTRVAAAAVAIAALAQLASAWVVAHLELFGMSFSSGSERELIETTVMTPTFGAPFSPALWSQLVAEPHSGSPMDILRTSAIAVAVICVCIWLCDARSRPVSGRVFEMFRSAGAASLTIYVMHVLMLGLLTQTAVLRLAETSGSGSNVAALPWWAIGLPALALHVTLALLIGLILMLLHRRGPLEALTSGIAKFVPRRLG